MSAFAHDRAWEVLVASILLGAAIGLTFSGMPNVIVESVPRDETGVATGINANLRTIGGAVGGQLTAVILSVGVLAGGYPSDKAIKLAFEVLAGVSIVAAIFAATVPRRLSPGQPRGGS
jgi:nitrate/nitrite transporter NarK